LTHPGVLSSRAHLFISQGEEPPNTTYTTRMSCYYNGPLSDHFDGVRFFDPRGGPPRDRRDLLRWFVDRHWRATKSKWPAWAPSPYSDRPPARVEGAACRISYIGHASLLVQTAGFNILLDPVWSKRASPFRFVGPKRVNNPGIDFADLPPTPGTLLDKRKGNMTDPLRHAFCKQLKFVFG
jgi:hypothetical protein